MLPNYKSDVFVEFSSPEKNLLCSILLRAWADLDISDRFIQNDAYNWINTKLVPATEKWSFLWVCGELGLNPKTVKRMMMSIPFHLQVQKLQPERHKRNTEKSLL